jgi:hypothetical protein
MGRGVDIPRDVLKAPSAADAEQISHAVSVEGVKRFVEAAAEARAALAALHPYSPDLRPHWDRFEVPESDTDELIDLLMQRRRQPTKRHRAGTRLPPA